MEIEAKDVIEAQKRIIGDIQHQIIIKDLMITKLKTELDSLKKPIKK